MSKASLKAYTTIRARIIAGRFTPGTRLKEEELVDVCGVSRTPIREALRRLHQEGLVNFVPNQGTYVTDWNAADLDEVFALRGVLESHAARVAAERITGEQIAKMRVLADTMDDAVARQLRDFDRVFIQANSEFHHTVLAAAANKRLTAMVDQVIEIPIVLRTLQGYSPEDIERSLQHHRELIAAFEARDPAWAEAVMRSHIHAAHHSIMRRTAENRPIEPPLRVVRRAPGTAE